MTYDLERLTQRLRRCQRAAQSAQRIAGTPPAAPISGELRAGAKVLADTARDLLALVASLDAPAEEQR